MEPFLMLINDVDFVNITGIVQNQRYLVRTEVGCSKNGYRLTYY